MVARRRSRGGVGPWHVPGRRWGSRRGAGPGDRGRAAGLAVALAAPALLLAACSTGGPAGEGEEGGDVSPSTGPVAVETLFQEQHTGFEESRREVVTDAGRWREVWRTAHQGREPAPPVPEVDFATHSVLLAAMGQRTTGGYEIAIPEVRGAQEGLVATVVAVSPGEGCMVTQALTAPATAVRVPAADDDVTFEERPETLDCG